MTQKRPSSSRKSTRKTGARRGRSEKSRRVRDVRSDAPPLTLPEALATPEPPEPRMIDRLGLSTWVLTLLVLALYGGALYVDNLGGHFHPLVIARGETVADLEARVPRRSATDALMARGRWVYATYCAACHQPDARGRPGQFPPLAGSEWVTAPGPNRLIRIMLNGLQGPVTVGGQQFNNVMLAWRTQLKDEDIAAVLTYVRGNREWGNHAGPVTPEQVAAIRALTQDKQGYWTAEELLALPDSD